MSGIGAAGSEAPRKLDERALLRGIAHQQHVSRIELAGDHALEVDADAQPAAQGHVKVLRGAEAGGACFHEGIVEVDGQSTIPEMGEPAPATGAGRPLAIVESI